MTNPLERPVPPVVFVAYSGTGKTTLLRQLIPVLTARGVRIAMIKHAHHEFDIDKPGKDSYELRKAGARQMLIASSQRWALMTEHEAPHEPSLAELIRHIDTQQADLILVEGFKHEDFPKIELHRPTLGHPYLFPGDTQIVAIATDEPDAIETQLPLLPLNSPEIIADFLVQNFLEV